MPNDHAPASVSTSEVRVGKAFEADEFPVPAIAFEIESLAEEPIRVRIIDRIPDSFPMEGIGFHPDYDSDNWTAYRDNRVEYERVLEAGESVLTVYGIRIDDPAEAEAFLGEPTVETDPVDEGAPADTAEEGEDVLGRETTQVVRDALTGEDSGLGDGALLKEDPDPRDLESDATVVLGEGDEDAERMSVDEGEAEAEGEDEGEEDDAAPSGEVSRAADPRRTPGESDTVGDRAVNPEDQATESPDAVPGSVAAALAAELRDGDVDEADVAALRDHLETEGGDGVSTSVDARIERLQSQVEDINAYRDALEAFLDEEGTAEELLTEVRDELGDLSDRVESVDERLADADADRADLDERLEVTRETVQETSETVEDLSRRLDEEVDAALGDLEERLDGLETDIDERLGAVESDIDDIHAELEELQEFRERLSSAFGPGEG